MYLLQWGVNKVLFELLLFVLFWVHSWLLHELMHALECNWQTRHYGVIKIIKWHGIPYSMMHMPNMIPKRYNTYLLAGGWFTSIFMFICFLVSVWAFSVSSYIAYLFGFHAVLQGCYGLFEMCALPVWGVSHRYAVGRYCLYLVVFVVVGLCWWVV